MSASSIVSFSRLIAALMSGAGRDLTCRHCGLRFEFPAGSHYESIVKQVDSHFCGSPRPLKGEAFYSKTITVGTATSEVLNRFDFDHSATPMWVFESSTLAFSAVNAAAVHHYGYSRKEFLSMTILDICPSDDIVPTLRDVLNRGIHNSAREVWKHKRKNGSLIDVRVTSMEALFDGCIANIVTAVEVTRHVMPPKST
jgi:PAS domain S-box-containing protein